MGTGAALDARPRWTAFLGPVVPLGVLTAASWVGTVTAPALAATSPLLLMALSPRLLFLALAADRVPAAAFFAVGLARLVVADPLHYLIGRHGYERLAGSAVGRAPPARRAHEAACRAVRRAGPVVIALRPNGPVLCAAGACRIRPRQVAVADVVGTSGYLGAVWLIGPSVVPQSLGLITAGLGACAVTGCVVLGGLGAWQQRRDQRGRRAALLRGAHPCLAAR